MESKMTRRAVLAGAPAVAAVAALPTIPVLAAPQQDPIAVLGRQWQAARERWRHWSTVEDEMPAKGSPEHKEAESLFDKANDEMLEVEGAMSRGQATTVAGILARWEIIEWLGDYCDSSNPSDHDPKAIAMRADLERLAAGAA